MPYVWRLMYGSAVLGVIIPKFHFAIKVAQRRINLLNRFPGIANKDVELPWKIRAKLGEWRNELVYNMPRVPLPHPDFAPHKHKLYTDASGKGWGGILYLDSGEVSIVGGAWEPDWQYEVNRAEAMAVRLSLEKFESKLERGTCLELWIDNTSCKAAFNRRICKSDGIAQELSKVLKWAEKRGVCITAQYISTKNNPAHPISRKF